LAALQLLGRDERSGILVNTTTTNDQRGSDVATDAEQFFATWISWAGW
jgi:hypothetical protein